MAVVMMPYTYYNITGLARGQSYYIRVTAHNSLGYGAHSHSYLFAPREQAGAVYKPAMAVATQAADLVTYARSLNVTWGYPQLRKSDPVGDGGLGDVSGYVVEWARQPFASFTPTVQDITIQCDNLTIPFQYFRLQLQVLFTHL